MTTLSERLEVRLAPETVRALRREAERCSVPVAQLVRDAIDAYLEADRQARLQAAEELFRVEAPTADWDQMEREIEASHLDRDTT